MVASRRLTSDVCRVVGSHEARLILSARGIPRTTSRLPLPFLWRPSPALPAAGAPTSLGAPVHKRYPPGIQVGGQVLLGALDALVLEQSLGGRQLYRLKERGG